MISDSSFPKVGQQPSDAAATALGDGANRELTSGGSLMHQPPNAMFSGGEFAGSHFESLLGIYDTLLDRFMPPLILIDAERRVIDTFAGADRFLKVGARRPSHDLLEMLLEPLRCGIGEALARCAASRQAVVTAPMRIDDFDTPSVGEAAGPGSSAEPFWFRARVAIVKPRGSDRDFYSIELEWSEPTPNRDGSAPEASGGPLGTMRGLGTVPGLGAGTYVNVAPDGFAAAMVRETQAGETQAGKMPSIGVATQRLSSQGVAIEGVASPAGVDAPAEASGPVKGKLVDVETFCDINGLGMVILDPALRIQKFSAAAASQFGLLPQDIGRDFRTFAGGIDSGDVVDRLMECVGTGEADEFEIRQDRKGSWHLAKVVPLGDLAGGQAGVMLTLIDLGSIEGRRREDQRLSSIVRWSTDAIIGRDIENRIVAWNPAAEQLYGYSAEEVLGTKADMIIPETESEGLQSSLKAFRRDQRVERFDSSRKTKGGDVLRVSVRMSPIRDEEHRVIGVSTIERDVADGLTAKGVKTERANEEANSREDLENEFRQAIRQRDQFLAMLSHELRNPLGAILNTCAVLGKRKLMAKSVQGPISIVARQARQMAELLDDLLDVSRITTGKIKLEKGLVTLASIADEAIESQQALASTRGQRLTVTYCDEPLQVFGDRSRLVQVVVNLLNNAIKYTAEGGRITVILERRGRHGVIRVRDTGVGLEPDQIESLFEMFAQKDSTLDRSGGGMGLGLHLVRKLVSFHTGTVRGFSEGIGKGSEFVVELPLSTRKTLESREPSGTAAASRKPKVKRIVIVEDIDDARNMLVALLESDGHQVTAAANGETGLELILKECPDLAIVDIGLPKIDGYEVARRVREVYPASDLRLVALTGYGQDSDHARVLEAGFDAHLVKPLNHNRLEMILAGG